MKRPNRLDKIFLILGPTVLAAGLLHTGIAYALEIVRQHEKPFSTSFPPEVMLFLFLPYAAALAVLFAVWLGLHERRRGVGRADVAIRVCGALVLLTAAVWLVTVILLSVCGGRVDIVEICGVSAPFFALAAPMLLTMLVCFLVKKFRPAGKKAEEGEKKDADKEE